MASEESHYGAVVLGSGPSGRTVSLRLAKNSFSVAFVENELVGGDCSLVIGIIRIMFVFGSISYVCKVLVHCMSLYISSLLPCSVLRLVAFCFPELQSYKR